MREHVTVADHVRHWARRLCSAAVRSLVPTAVAAVVVVPSIPAPDEVADGADDFAPVASIADVHAPPPDAATGETDANPSTGNGTAMPYGLPVENTTIVAPAHQGVTDFSTTEIPASPPTGTGLTRAPPASAALLA